jgi:hypothetical protein
MRSYRRHHERGIELRAIGVVAALGGAVLPHDHLALIAAIPAAAKPAPGECHREKLAGKMWQVGVREDWAGTDGQILSQGGGRASHHDGGMGRQAPDLMPQLLLYHRYLVGQVWLARFNGEHHVVIYNDPENITLLVERLR